MKNSGAGFASPRWRRPLRWALMGTLVLLLLIPLGMVESVVQERHNTYRGVLREIAGLWSGEQVLTGPILLVPFTERYQVEKQHVGADGEKRVELTWKSCSRTAVILPRSLDLEGTMEPRVRRRGIYEASVYENEIRLSGHFDALQDTVGRLANPDRTTEIHWDRAALAIGLTQPRGIVRITSLSETDGLRFAPGALVTDVLPTGFHAPAVPVEADRFDFVIGLEIHGSGGFRLAPLGERTRATLTSSWTHPSFYGEVVPDAYEITESGFTANWDLSHLIRAYPQDWLAGTEVNLSEVTAGVRLFEPVDLYARVTRSVKYGLLFIVLTFLTLGLIELVSGSRLHLLQYLLIGLALALFFLLLIAFAEHRGFGQAYLIASATVVLLNSSYCLAVLPRRALAGLVAAVLGALYGTLYAILQAEDYALLSGTLLLVAALAATMFFTRKLGNETRVEAGERPD